MSPYVLHRDPAFWENPIAFQPERFLQESAPANRPRYAYIPFGVGPHVCPGAALAINEILITVAILAQRLRFRLVPGHAIEPAAWTTLRPRTGILVTIERR
jgi:cytochrome P450